MKKLIYICCAMMLIHCGGEEVSVANETKQPGNSSTKTTSSQASNSNKNEMDQLITKLNRYTNCINGPSNSAISSFNRYLSWVDRKKGVTGKERHTYGLYRIPNVDSCLKEIEKALAEVPVLNELDELAKDYVVKLNLLVPIVKRANEYYDQENYKDDNYAEGKEIHPELVKAFDDFLSTSKKFRGAYDAESYRMRLTQLQELEKQGDSFELFSERALLNAKQIVQAGNVPGWKDIDLAKFTELVTSYTADVKKLEQYMDSNKEEMKKIMMVSSYLDKHKSFLKAAKNLMRRARDKTPYTTGEKMNVGRSSEWMVSGSPGQLVHNYNSLVNSVPSRMPF